LNVQRYRDENLRPIVVPFICHHHLVFQNDNARPHVTRICIQFLVTENVPVLPWPAYSPYMPPIELWIDLYVSVFQYRPTPNNIAEALKRTWTTFRRPQSTA
jgi:hypothetical protein